MSQPLRLALALAACLGGLPAARAQEVVITVGGDKAKGKEVAEATGGVYAKSLSKGFKAVSEQLAKGGEMTVVLKVAAGDYDGDLGAGAYELPSFRNEKAALRFEGGYSADFSSRDPFRTPTRLVTVKDRSLPLWQFFNSRPADQDVVASFTIDGFLFDVGNSNSYDKQTNSLLLGRGTSTWPIIRFSNLRTDLLDIKNCVFVNASHRAFETLVRPLTRSSRIRLYNTIFLNCLMPVKLDYALTRDSEVSEFEVDHCSFLLCWGANPDVNTSNPCALEWGSEAKRIKLTNNLFYANFGGAICALTASKLVVNNNNFVGNGLLHGDPAPGAVAMVVDAGGKKRPIGLDLIEDVDFVAEAEGNVSIAPGINLALGSVTSVDASKVEAGDTWQNDVRRLLGRPVEGGKVEIRDFAPRKEYDAQNPPFPTEEAAKPYGASPDLVGR